MALQENITPHFHRCNVKSRNPIYGVPGRSPVVYTMVWFEPSLKGCGVVASLALVAFLPARTYVRLQAMHASQLRHLHVLLILVLVSFALHCYLPVETRSTIALP